MPAERGCSARARRLTMVRRCAASTAASECSRSRDAVNSVTGSLLRDVDDLGYRRGGFLAAQFGSVSLRELVEPFGTMCVELA